MFKRLRNNIIYNNLKYAIKYFLNFSDKRSSNREKINIVFLVAKPEVWNSVKTIYDSAAKNEHINLYLIALPSFIDGKFDLDSDVNYDFCKSINENAVRAYDKSNDRYFDVRSVMPDYVIYSSPYPEIYPDEYSFKNLSEICKLCYVSYGYSLVKSKLQRITVRPEVIEYMSFIFSCNSIIYKCYRKNMFLSELISGKRLYNIGFPRFDLYRNINGSIQKKISTIMWLPRWTSTREEENGNEPSSFFEVKEAIVNYAEDNPDVNMIFRPHPKAFENYIKNGLMTLDEVDKFKERISMLNNVLLDTEPSYYENLIKSDVIIADFSSIVAEFFILKRPIIYFGTNKNFPIEHMEMFDSFYHVKTWQEAEVILNKLKLGIDPKKLKREHAVEKFMKNYPQNIGEHIVEILISDYNKK